MTKRFKQNLQAGFGLILALLIFSSIASYYSISNLIDSARLVDHTNQVLRESEEIISAMKDGETGQRGYLLSGQTDYLIPYKTAFQRSMESLKTVRELTRDNISQQSTCSILQRIIEERFEILDQSITNARMKLPLNTENLSKGQSHMEEARRLIVKIQDTEKILLRARTARLNKFITYTPVIILLASLLAVISTLFFFKKVMDDFTERTKLNARLEQKDREVNTRIGLIESVAQKVVAGDFSVRVDDAFKDGLGSLAQSLNKMTASLETSFSNLKDNEWLQKGIAQLSEKIAGEKSAAQVAEEALHFLAGYTNSITGALYLVSADKTLVPQAGYALPNNFMQQSVSRGSGIAGQCLVSNQLLIVDGISSELHTVYAGGIIKPQTVIAFPLHFEGQVTGIAELGTAEHYSPLQLNFFRQLSEILGVALNTAENRVRLKALLEETQAQTEELQAQQEELENINAELELQAEKLQRSEEELKVQQEELMETNQELEERSRLLEEKNQLIIGKNLDIQKKAEELELATRYKSEFLANMSHELRTPLNAVLLLSRLLAENNTGNLNPDQVEYAHVIQNSGNGLLRLIDEILDLSKIESGKLELENEQVAIPALVEEWRQLFEPMAKEKDLELTVELAPGIPAQWTTDQLRLGQIIKNLLSNALKFTSTGSIHLSVQATGETILFSVSDTGIGIAPEKQQFVFEAFQQADGSTRRKYGGTGLGLSISRQLARLLGGDISLESALGKGSRFTLELPLDPMKRRSPEQPLPPPPGQPGAASHTTTGSSPYISNTIPEQLPDDRHHLTAGDKRILIVEDDIPFASALLDFTRQKGYKGIVVVRGDEVLDAAKQYQPTGILLDIQLPVKDGFTVLDELKQDTSTRQIPVHIMSSFQVKKESLSRGAIDFINKPVLFDQLNKVLEKIEKVLQSGPQKVLIVEDNSQHARALAYFLASHQIAAEIKADINESVSALTRKEAHCVILDMGLPSIRAYEALERVKQDPALENIPIIVFTGKSLSRAEEVKIRQYTDSIIVKTAHSYQRILNEVSLFLHLVNDVQTEKTGRANRKTLMPDLSLQHKTVLVADDDVRNIFALTKSLEAYKMIVITALDGKEALKLLHEKPVDIVLMDMMMPEMDGYETIKQIRQYKSWKRLPIIAVTAKAMTGDREKCIEAGASDYITKPVDTDQLISLMRIWLYEAPQ